MKTCFDCKAGLPLKTGPAQSAELLAKSRAEHAALQAGILTAARRKTRSAIAFFVVAALILAMDVWASAGRFNLGQLGAAYAIVVLTSIFMGRHRGLTAVEYYSITGSRSSDGEHRCIFCGNRGIYTQGEYAGTTKYASCSKCKEPLFYH